MENRSMKVAYISESPILSDFKKQKFLNRQQQISATYQTFGDIIQNLMKTLEIDTRKASELTGLNESFFRNLKKRQVKSKSGLLFQ